MARVTSQTSTMVLKGERVKPQGGTFHAYTLTIDRCKRRSQTARLTSASTRIQGNNFLPVHTHSNRMPNRTVAAHVGDGLALPTAMSTSTSAIGPPLESSSTHLWLHRQLESMSPARTLEQTLQAETACHSSPNVIGYHCLPQRQAHTRSACPRSMLRQAVAMRAYT